MFKLLWELGVVQIGLLALVSKSIGSPSLTYWLGGLVAFGIVVFLACNVLLGKKLKGENVQQQPVSG